MIWNSEQFGPNKKMECFKCVQLYMLWYVLVGIRDLDFIPLVSGLGLDPAGCEWNPISRRAAKWRDHVPCSHLNGACCVQQILLKENNVDWWSPLGLIFFSEFLLQHQIPSHKLKEISVNRILVRKRCWVLLHPRHLALLTHVTTGEGTSLSPLVWRFPLANHCKIPNIQISHQIITTYYNICTNNWIYLVVELIDF